MEKEADKTQQIEDILFLEDNVLNLGDIELIATNAEICKRYENEYKGSLPKLILRSLTHETFSEEEAEQLWNEILAHLGELNRVLGRNVGVAVASLDYLANIKKKLSEPKIIEEDKSKFVASATTKDELTDLYARDVFDVVLKKEVAEANRTNSSLCLLMIDIDDFKMINDTYGHQEGDAVLQKIGAALNESVREMDTAVRYGGEELSIIMPETPIDKARDAAQRIREAVAEIQFTNFSVTVSIGVSQTSKLITTPDQLIRSADKALYKAKAKGKNQVVLAGLSE